MIVQLQASSFLLIEQKISGDKQYQSALLTAIPLNSVESLE